MRDATAAYGSQANRRKGLKMETTIHVCGNDETICDGYTDDRTAAWRAEIAAEFVRAACRIIDDSGLAMSEVASNFHDWHGGRHYRTGNQVAGRPWGYSGGLVVCHERDVPDAIRKLCDEAQAAGDVARDKAIAKYEAVALAED